MWIHCLFLRYLLQPYPSKASYTLHSIEHILHGRITEVVEDWTQCTDKIDSNG